MQTHLVHSIPTLLPLPEPTTPISVREATLADVPFIDELQKKQRNALGFMFLTAIQEKIERGEILIAEDGSTRVGYCIGADRYFKHDDVGIIYQMNVVGGRQRSFIGATLLKAMFDRAAYGCKLFCAWCAQDLKANYFWEAMGLVPLAYRAGSEKKARVHIFWQKRIREGDTGERATPWWFPAKTDAGAIRADRIVLPIPMGKHWSEEMPVLLTQKSDVGVASVAVKSRRLKPPLPEASAPVVRPSKQFGPPRAQPVNVVEEPAIAEKPKREKQPKVKADPKLIAAARELRDRWLEKVNGGELLIEDAGKYDVTRALPGMPDGVPQFVSTNVMKALPQAA